MSLLTLRDIGKIYVSEGSVAVGIRGVNLSFSRGEFVAVTGKSGSGKSTLLNVISGMDSYEEGELYIEGKPTSHYLQPEWEEYRQRYISFIFQDYNIIESFTVLQNVELALMHIEDKKERRRRALELIDRVGLSSHIRHKGSRLSGGQKQRTVIARALAKDSPIILADEPTGNLDSTTSREIMELLREVSSDKLLIVVTHNFEQVEAYATRHIRIFDGAVESDHVLRTPNSYKEAAACLPNVQKKRSADLKNGMTLGRTVFAAKPKLSLFLCLLMIVGAFGVFAVTSLFDGASTVFEKNYMFEPIEGRVILTKQNGEVLTEEELQGLVSEYGAEGYLRYDVLLDQSGSQYVPFSYGSDSWNMRQKLLRLRYTYGKDYGGTILGRYPEAGDEVLLYLPIHYQPTFGKDEILIETLNLNGLQLKVAGVKYYYDNTKPAECLFTAEGFRMATAAYYLMNQADLNVTVTLTRADGSEAEIMSLYELLPLSDIEDGKLAISSAAYQKYLENHPNEDIRVQIGFEATYYSYNYHYTESSDVMVFQERFTEKDLADTLPILPERPQGGNACLVISPTLLCQIAENVLRESYRQASLFFENDKEAYRATEGLREKGYIAVPSDTTYTPDAFETVLNMALGVVEAFAWLLSIVFLAFFINLCSSRTLNAFKGDMAIMRSMGISVRVIRIGMYVRMLMALIPAYLFVLASAAVVFLTPVFNEYFTFLHAWQYLVIFLGMLILTLRITHKQVRRLFGESVKKSLKGGAAE